MTLIINGITVWLNETLLYGERELVWTKPDIFKMLHTILLTITSLNDNSFDFINLRNLFGINVY